MLASHQRVYLEFAETDKVLLAQVLASLSVIITVVHFDLVSLLSLEVVVGEDLLDELGVERVVDDLSLADLNPAAVWSHLEKHEEGVRLRAVLHEVHVGQIFAPKAELELV